MTARSIALTRRQATMGLLSAATILATPRVARASAPKRVVALGSTATEIVYALGEDERIVAADSASVRPAAAVALPKLGFYRSATAEAVLAYRPDLVIAADGAGPAPELQKIAAAGVQVLNLGGVSRLADISARVTAIARAIAVEDRGAALAEAMLVDLALVGEDLARVETRRRTLALLGRADAHALIAGGRGSPAAFALELAGAENAASMLTGWGALSPQAASELDPEAVILLETGAKFDAGQLAEAKPIKGTAAERNGRLGAVDALDFVSFGPRTPQAIHAAAAKIYPEIAFRPLPPRDWLETAGL